MNQTSFQINRNEASVKSVVDLFTSETMSVGNITIDNNKTEGHLTLHLCLQSFLLPIHGLLSNYYVIHTPCPSVFLA